MQPQPPGIHQIAPYRGQIVQDSQPQQYPAPQTVWGVPLYDGERVIYYYRLTSLWERASYVLYGIILLPVLGVGLIFIYYFFTYNSNHARALAVTNYRLLGITPNRTLKEQIAINQITRLVHRSGGGKNHYVVHTHGDLMIIHHLSHAYHLLEPILNNLSRANEFPTVNYES
ncbi:MAG: hypothetical protein AB7K71_38285 [Polyangiaceae bacterium]